MEAIKKKMQAMKVEKDNACDRADVCEEASKVAKVRAEKAEDEVSELTAKARQLETELDLCSERLGIVSLQLEEKEKALLASEAEMNALNRRVSGLEEDDIARNEVARGQPGDCTLAPYTGSWRQCMAQGSDRVLGATLLHESEQGVHADHHEDDRRVLEVADSRREDRSDDKQQDQAAAELGEQHAEARAGRFLRDAVRAEALAPPRHFVTLQTEAGFHAPCPSDVIAGLLVPVHDRLRRLHEPVCGGVRGDGRRRHGIRIARTACENAHLLRGPEAERTSPVPAARSSYHRVDGERLRYSRMQTHGPPEELTRHPHRARPVMGPPWAPWIARPIPVHGGDSAPCPTPRPHSLESDTNCLSWS